MQRVQDRIHGNKVTCRGISTDYMETESHAEGSVQITWKQSHMQRDQYRLHGNKVTCRGISTDYMETKSQVVPLQLCKATFTGVISSN
jgi:hypothetical protein